MSSKMRQKKMMKKTVLVLLTFVLVVVMTACNNGKKQERELIEQLIKLTTPDQLIESGNGFSVQTTFRCKTTEYMSTSNYAKNSDGLYEMSGQLYLGGAIPWSYYMSSDEADPLLYIIEDSWGEEEERKQQALSEEPLGYYRVVKTSFTNSFSEYNVNGSKVVLDEMRDSKRYVVVEKEEGGGKTTYSYLFDETGDKIEELNMEREVTGEKFKYEFSYEPTILIDRKPKVENMDDITADLLLKMLIPENIVERFGAFSYNKSIHDYNYDRVENLGTFHFIKNPSDYYEMNEEHIDFSGEAIFTYIDTDDKDPYYYIKYPYTKERMEKEPDTLRIFTNYITDLYDPENCQIVTREKIDQTYVITLSNEDTKTGWLPRQEICYFDASNGRLTKIVSRLTTEGPDDPKSETIYEFRYDPDMTLAYAPYVPKRPADEEVNGVSLDDLIRLTTPINILDSKGAFSLQRIEDHGDYLELLETEEFVKNPDGYYEMNLLIDYDDGKFEYTYVDSRSDESYCYIYSSEGKSKVEKSEKFWDDLFTGSMFHLNPENTRISSVVNKGATYEVTVNIYTDEELSGTHVMTIDAYKKMLICDIMDTWTTTIMRFTYEPSIRLKYVPER